MSTFCACNLSLGSSLDFKGVVCISTTRGKDPKAAQCLLRSLGDSSHIKENPLLSIMIYLHCKIFRLHCSAIPMSHSFKFSNFQSVIKYFLSLWSLSKEQYFAIICCLISHITLFIFIFSFILRDNIKCINIKCVIFKISIKYK